MLTLDRRRRVHRPARPPPKNPRHRRQAVTGTACAYLALLVWYHQEVRWLAHPPVLNLAAILVVLPTAAYLGGWLLAARQPRAITRQPLD